MGSYTGHTGQQGASNQQGPHRVADGMMVPSHADRQGEQGTAGLPAAKRVTRVRLKLPKPQDRLTVRPLQANTHTDRHSHRSHDRHAATGDTQPAATSHTQGQEPQTPLPAAAPTPSAAAGPSHVSGTATQTRGAVVRSSSGGSVDRQRVSSSKARTAEPAVQERGLPATPQRVGYRSVGDPVTWARLAHCECHGDIAYTLDTTDVLQSGDHRVMVAALAKYACLTEDKATR